MHTKARTQGTKKKARKGGRPTELDPSALLDAAEVLFSEKGFDGTTTREIGKRARCNIALISYHFGSKDGLYQALLVRHFEKIRNRYRSIENCPIELEKSWPELSDPDERFFCATLFELARAILSESRMQKIVCREMMTGAVKMAAAIKRSEGGAFKMITERLESLQKSGKIRKDIDLRMGALGLMGPLIYSNIASPLMREVYAIDTTTEDYARRATLHLTRVFFSGAT